MTVEILRLSGLDAAEAKAAASRLLDLRTGPRDLHKLLVVDETALLAAHETVYVSLDTAGRVQDMVCVAVGPRVGNDRRLCLPGSLGGTQGPPVLWVSDPVGIDCRVSVAAIAIGHPPGKASGLDLLVEILLAEEMFSSVHRTLTISLPHRVANPGMRLAGQDDEAATFAAALILAIRTLCGPGSGVEGPFRELLPSEAHGASLAEDGPLARYRSEVTAASDNVERRTRLGRRLRPGQVSLNTRLVEAGAALTDLRDLIVQLLRNANTIGELTDNQRGLIEKAGIRFPTGPPYESARVSGPVAEQPLVYRTVVRAVQGGDTLTLVSRRLTLTERELKHRGSGGYLQDVEERCPQSLLDRLDQLAGPPERLARRATDEVRPEQELAHAAQAATGLEDLVLSVASREWSPIGPSRTEVGRIRAALDGTGKALTEYADKVSRSSKARGARLARLAEVLSPVLRDLVFQVVGAEITQPSATGLEAFGVAQGRAGGLIAEWLKHVQANGISSQAPFPTSNVSYGALDASAADVVEIREALLYRPAEEMWQLCGSDDLQNVLNLTETPVAVRFASRLDKDALASMLSGESPVWTSSGSNAGLLRLVALRSEYISLGWWGEPPQGADPSSDMEPS